MNWINLESVEAICAHFGRCYRELLASYTGDEQKMGIGRRLIHAHARKALVEKMNWPDSDAIEMAHEICGLEPGAILPKLPELLGIVPKIVKKMGGVEAAKVAGCAHFPKPPQPCPTLARHDADCRTAKVLFPKDDSNSGDSWAF